MANFEGLLVYDYARWCIYRTDKYTRTEKLVKLQSGRIVVYDYRGNAFILENEELVPCSDELLRQDKVVFSGIRKEVNDLHGGCWSLTEQGILYTARNSAFSFIDESQGLKGEVLSLIDTPDGLYAGTTTGLYLCTSDRFEKLEGINTTCWQIVPVPDDPGYLVATSQGVFYVENRKIVWKYTNLHTLAVCYSGKSAWVGELDRLRYFDFDKDAFTQEVSINNPYKILTAKDGTLWVSTLPKCECFYFLPNDNTPHKTPMEGTLVTEDDDIYIRGIENTWVWNTQTHSLTKQTLIENDNEHYMVLFSYTAPNGQSFIGNSNGKGLQAMKSREESIDYCQWCTPFE
ncbi:MAG: hypothetical protein HUK03_00570, partial [Bacteroidaceae bacterium]|nr:hypothetical protein [Bacteroidaceae bacterium]